MRDLRDIFPRAPMGGMKKMQGVLTFNAKPEFTLHDGSPKEELFKRESPKPFFEKSRVPFENTTYSETPFFLWIGHNFPIIKWWLKLAFPFDEKLLCN